MSYKSVIQFWTNYQLPVQPPSPNMYTKTIVAAAGQATNSIFLSFLGTAFINLAKSCEENPMPQEIQHTSNVRYPFYSQSYRMRLFL